MKRTKSLVVIEPEVIEPELIPAEAEIPTIRLQRVPNLTNAIAFALLAIREAKRNKQKLNVEINLTNVYCFDVPVEPEPPNEIDSVKNILKGLI